MNNEQQTKPIPKNWYGAIVTRVNATASRLAVECELTNKDYKGEKVKFDLALQSGKVDLNDQSPGGNLEFGMAISSKVITSVFGTCEAWNEIQGSPFAFKFQRDEEGKVEIFGFQKFTSSVAACGERGLPERREGC